MKILVVEDDLDTRQGLQMLLEEFGLDVRAAPTLAEARAQLAAFDPDVCLTDLQLPDGDGIDFIREARAEDPLREVVVLTGHGSLDSAVEAMKAGAFDYLVKPLRPVQLEAVLGRLRRGGAGRRRATRRCGRRSTRPGRFGSMVGVSSAMRDMCAVIARVARSDAPVMITGESGSGKEAAAQTIHDLSRRRGKPLVAINCGAVSANLIESELFGHEKGAFTGADRRRAGYFELAQGGTLFLDEVTEMPPDLQVKFLRVLETRSFRRVGGNEEIASDVRIVSSSNRDLARGRREADAARGPLLPAQRPPAPRPPAPRAARRHPRAREALPRPGRRERGRRPAGLLAGGPREARRARVAGKRAGAPERRSPRLRPVGRRDPSTRPPWRPFSPGGRAACFRPCGLPPVAPRRAKGGGRIRPAGRAGAARRRTIRSCVPVRVGDSLEEVERRLLERTLAAVGGNKRKAAEMLRVSLKTVYNKIKQYEIER